MGTLWVRLNGYPQSFGTRRCSMRPLIVRQLGYDLPCCRLAACGAHALGFSSGAQALGCGDAGQGCVANSDIARAYLGLLTQGKSDFDAVENFRGDAFFKQALGIGLLPSSPTLRQRMDARARRWLHTWPATPAPGGINRERASA